MTHSLSLFDEGEASACDHSATEVIYKLDSRGRKLWYRRCLKCGAKVSDWLPHAMVEENTMSRSLSSFTPAGKARLISQFEGLLEDIRALPTITPCVLCDWFEANNCKHWKQPVPLEAQAVGCSEWMEKLPF